MAKEDLGDDPDKWMKWFMEKHGHEAGEATERTEREAFELAW